MRSKAELLDELTTFKDKIIILSAIYSGIDITFDINKRDAREIYDFTQGLNTTELSKLLWNCYVLNNLQ